MDIENLPNDELMKLLNEMCENATTAASLFSVLSTEEKDQCLESIAQNLISYKEYIIKENAKDVEKAKKNSLSKPLLDRLILDENRIKKMADGLRELIKLEDPVGKILSNWKNSNGLEIKKVSTPIGVITIIYESRPNVTIDAAGLCLKAGNATILKGGSESINTNIALSYCIQQACIQNELDENIVQVIPWKDRRAINQLLKMDNYIDLVIPRGGENLIKNVVENSSIPVIKHYKGVCNIYLDNEYDKDMALKIIENSKCQKPGVCNAAENLILHRSAAKELAPEIAGILSKNKVELRGDEEFCSLVPDTKKAAESDWSTEYLDLILSVKVVPDMDSAIQDINKYGSKHSDLIITNNKEKADKFMKKVDASTVYHNASTRFTDGYAFGMGAEIGISTDKIHARGPMALKELTTYKYLVYGEGQIR